MVLDIRSYGYLLNLYFYYKPVFYIGKNFFKIKCEF